MEHGHTHLHVAYPAFVLQWQTGVAEAEIAIVPPYPQGTSSKTPSRWLKPWIVPNFHLFIERKHLKLLFGISKLPASTHWLWDHY